MDEQLHNDDILVRYLDGELGEHDVARLEARLKTDASLRQKLVDLQVAVQAVKQFGMAEQVSAVHRQMMDELKPGRKRGKSISISRTVRFTLAIAASLLVLFVGIRIYEGTQLTPEKLYSESFIDFNVSATRSANTSLLIHEKLYQQKDYNTIISLPRDTTSFKQTLLTGLAYMQTGQPAHAVAQFRLLLTKENEYRQDAEFYAALAFLKLEDYKNAVTLTQQIQANPSHLYHNQVSEEFMDKLKKLQAKND